MSGFCYEVCYNFLLRPISPPTLSIKRPADIRFTEQLNAVQHTKLTVQCKCIIVEGAIFIPAAEANGASEPEGGVRRGTMRFLSACFLSSISFSREKEMDTASPQPRPRPRGANSPSPLTSPSKPAILYPKTTYPCPQLA